MFTYPANQSFEDFNFPNHIPNFLNDVVANASDAIIQQCGGDARCIFDASQTGSIEIGLNTMEFDMGNVIDREQQGISQFNQNAVFLITNLKYLTSENTV